MSDFAVQTERIERSFGDVTAIDGIDLAVGRGEIYGFLGPNGAGKSTLVRILTTLLLPTAGRAEVAGFDVVREATKVRLHIGAALQEAALDHKQTGRELLRLQARLFGLSGKEADQRIQDLTPLIDIGDAMDRFIGTYSGGMKRRLDLAAALVHNPEVLFLDEPTTGLDPISRAKVWEEVRRINRQLNVTIFLTTQYLEEADALADRVGIINHGVLMAEGAPAALKRSIGSDVIVAKIDGESAAAATACGVVPGVHGVEVHGDELTVSVSRGAEVIGPVAIALNDCGVQVRELTLRTPSLDDVFLHFAGARIEEEAQAEETKEETEAT